MCPSFSHIELSYGLDLVYRNLTCRQLEMLLVFCFCFALYLTLAFVRAMGLSIRDSGCRKTSRYFTHSGAKSATPEKAEMVRKGFMVPRIVQGIFQVLLVQA